MAPRLRRVYVIQFPTKPWWSRRWLWTIVHTDDFLAYTSLEEARRSAEITAPHWYSLVTRRSDIDDWTVSTAYRIDGPPLWRILGLPVVDR